MTLREFSSVLLGNVDVSILPIHTGQSFRTKLVTSDLTSWKSVILDLPCEYLDYFVLGVNVCGPDSLIICIDKEQ